jgi:hypothetical protein
LKKRKENAKYFLKYVRSRLFAAKQGRGSGQKNWLSQTWGLRESRESERDSKKIAQGTKHSRRSRDCNLEKLVQGI